MILRAVIALALAFVAAAVARAEPHLAVANGLKCVACHVNAGGGGLRNDFGAIYGQKLLPAVAMPDPAVWSGRLGERLRLGADVRWTSLRTDVPGRAAQRNDGLDHARLHAEVTLVRGSLAAVLDEWLRPGSPHAQEAYLRLGEPATGGWALKAGRFYLPFGWRLPDATAFVRQTSGISMTVPDEGLEVGWEDERTSAQLALTRGPANAGTGSGHQVTAHAVRLTDWGRVGLSAAHTRSVAGDRLALAALAGLRTGPLAWLGEIDWVRDAGYPGGARRLLATLAEVDWAVARGHNVKADLELLDPDLAVRHDRRSRLSLVYELTPLPFVQLRLGWRRHDGIPQSPVDNRRLLFVEVHGYL